MLGPPGTQVKLCGRDFDAESSGNVVSKRRVEAGSSVNMVFKQRVEAGSSVNSVQAES